MSERRKPQLWSDFDGTAVEIVSKLNPRNWSKYPLLGIPGYADFMQGVTDGGVELSGIVSRRPNIAPRRYVTARSVAGLGLSFERAQLVLTGSEDRKAEHIVRQSQDGRTVGIIDDKPHRIGLALIDALLREAPQASGVQHIALGVVSHDKSEEYTRRLFDTASETDRAVRLSVNGDHPTYFDADNRFRLSIIHMEPYSVESGVQFAQQLHSL